MKQFDSVDEIVELYRAWGHDSYSEQVSQLSHAVQCAWLAQAYGATDELVVAALLHDIGHLIDLDVNGVRAEAFLVDLKHGAEGAQSLARLFPAAVTAPIAMHVDAKRWRCAVDAEYHATLSAASTASLTLQGGPMNAVERERFEAHPQWRAAAQLREWDDTGKSIAAVDPPFDRFIPLLRQIALR